MNETSFGIQYVIELFGCNKDSITITSFVKEAMEDSVKQAGYSIIHSVFHQFNPFGVSGVVVYRYAHMAIHTWPEYSYAAIDVFRAQPTQQTPLNIEENGLNEDTIADMEIINNLKLKFEASELKVKKIKREI